MPTEFDQVSSDATGFLTQELATSTQMPCITYVLKNGISKLTGTGGSHDW